MDFYEEAILAIVIHGSAVKKDGRRSLLVGSSSPHCDSAPILKLQEKTVSRDSTIKSEPGQDRADHDHVERLAAEREAAQTLANSLEGQLTELRKQLENEQKAARERGYREGFQQASEQVIADQLKEAEAIRGVLQSLAKEQVRLLQQAEEAAIEIGFAAAVKILGRASVDRSLAAAMVKQALSQVTERDGLVIYLSPADFDGIEQFRPQEGKSGEWSEIQFKSDERVGLGGCVIESRVGTLDARLEWQMSELKRLLIEARDKDGD